MGKIPPELPGGRKALSTTSHCKIVNYPHNMFGEGLKALLATPGPFCLDFFEPGQSGIDYFRDAKVLVIGAGGLGCELLKSLALTGFRNIDVIDMDTIDISNLNRQFLFREADVGKPKSVVAADFIKLRVPDCNITPHFCMIQDLDDTFYQQFHVIIGGLDSIKARHWISAKLVEIARRTNNEIQIPYIDGGTEEWKGHVKVIIPNKTACMCCQRSLFPPPVRFQECTVATSPRQPDHCVIWAKEIQWEKLRPGEVVDGDNDEHIQWIMDQALQHAARFGIEGITFQMTRGIVKNIIPAIASTQAIIAAMCATEALKIVTGAGPSIDNNALFAGDQGVFMNQFRFDRDPECEECSRRLQKIPRVDGETLEQLMERLKTDFGYPANAMMGNGEPLYLGIMAHTHENLKKLVSELIAPGTEVIAQARGQDPFEFTFDD